MNSPIILIAGEAGSGKDTVAALIKKHTANSQAIAQADPMKRFCAKVFGFTEEQLWGPSECRNAPDKKFTDVPECWDLAEHFITDEPSASRPGYTYDWLREVLPTRAGATSGLGVPHRQLIAWFKTLRASYANKPLTPRAVLQLLGTEWGRAVDPAMWTKHAMRTARKLLEGGQYYSRSAGVIDGAASHGIPDFVLITDGRFPNEIVNAAASNAHRLLVFGPTPAELTGGVTGHSSEAFLKKIPRHWFTATLYNDKAQGLVTLERIVKRYVQSVTRPERFGAATSTWAMD